MPSQLMSHSTLYIGKVKTVSPLFFLTILTFADYLHDLESGNLLDRHRDSEPAARGRLCHRRSLASACGGAEG